jgi:triosephosphate isomerase (TIM)
MAMKHIFINLKRFEVPKYFGGVSPLDLPEEWIGWVMKQSIEYGIGKLKDVEVVFLLPESLIINAVDVIKNYAPSLTRSIKIGCQGVFREDIEKGGNFGAFTTNRPAASMKALGCYCSIIGHSEERKDKLGVIAKFDPSVLNDPDKSAAAKRAVDQLINMEVHCALNAGLKVLVCLGETLEEKGEGGFEEQKPRIEAVLKTQLENSLYGFEPKGLQDNIAIGYEPIWAIGPGKTPPGGEYISFVSAFIKENAREIFRFDPIVVYGGGLKEENAGMIAKIASIDGGLIALTRFSGDIGFYPEELAKIIDKYLE